MKYIILVLLAVFSGMFGGYISHENGIGATAARTTITSPWTFQATTTTANIVATTANNATSSAQVGCIQSTATSTATPIHFVIGSIATSSTSYEGSNTIGLVGWRYGNCPRI